MDRGLTPDTAELIVAAGVILRTVPLLSSATSRLPVGSKRRSVVKSPIRALVDGPPSPVLPAMPVPASVDRIPELSTLRSLRFPLSEIYRLPLESTAIPCGELRNEEVAAAPSPLNLRRPFPAIVLTFPLVSTLRTRRLNKSITYRLPAASAATPLGWS